MGSKSEMAQIAENTAKDIFGATFAVSFLFEGAL